MPNNEEIFSGPQKIFCVGLEADVDTRLLKFRHLSISGASRFAKLSGIPSEFMLMVNMEFL